VPLQAARNSEYATPEKLIKSTNIKIN